MQVFTVRPDGFARIRKKMLWRLVPFFLGLIIILLVATSFYQLGSFGFAMSSELYFPIVVAIFFGWRLYREVSKQKKIYETYTLTIDDFSITREQHNTPPFTIYIDNVTDIIKNKHAAFIIKGKSAAEIIVVPSQMDNYDELEGLLNTIKPITTDTKSLRSLKVRALLAITGIVLMIVVNVVDNKIVIAIVAPVAVGLLTWNFIAVQKNKNIDHTAKRFSWIMLLVIALTIVAAYMKLTA